VRPESSTLRVFAQLGIRLFWLRQMMFIGATVITTIYLSSYIPIFCYVLCLSAEFLELYLGRKTISATQLSAARIARLTLWQTLVAGWSALTIGNFAVLVAWLGEPEFLFVPLTYLFSAALYASMFNCQIKSVLATRMALYALAFLALAGVTTGVAQGDQPLLGIALVTTVLSSVIFLSINAFLMHQRHVVDAKREREAVEREGQLIKEISDRQEAEVARESSNLRFRSLFQNAPIPIREEDLSGMKNLIDGLNLPNKDALTAFLDSHPEFLDACAKGIKVIDANCASLRQHGYEDKSEMLAKVVTTLSPAARDVVRMTVMALYEGAPGRSYETKITRADGAIRTVAATWSVMPGHEKTYGRILLCSVDLTDRLAAEEALRQAQKMEAVGQLTSGVAHDFNNLLTIIRGNIDLMQAEFALDPDLSRPIKAAVDRGAELTQRLLAFSRKQPLATRTFDMGVLVSNMGALLRRTIGQKNTIDFELSDGLWPVHADPGQVEAALLNFTLNARDAIENGGRSTVSCRNVSVEAENDLELESGDYVVLSVSDTGTGMEADALDRAVEPFFTTKEVGKGSGLGLSMAYGFAKQSGGALQITSAPGEGTEVSLYLPRSKQTATEQVSEPDVVPSTEVRCETVLVLEDDDGVRRYLARLLTNAGYQVVEAGSANTAKEVIKKGTQIDMIVSDILLPNGVLGTEFICELQADGHEVPVLFISGNPPEAELAKSGIRKPANILAKPFTSSVFLEKISALMAEKETEMATQD